ncbi:chemotaxis protein CheW [Desulfuromonas acetoxidans]|uniref:chemotaxis protein CheW n=1 Tax=Desulfuromonas acetoxidans TaxID=891 RepID=UPI00292F17D3|nr:chemotaxis protein CheW [Desulfuromonas acetoxidans]
MADSREQRILKQRAEQLARPDDTIEVGRLLPVVEFRLAQEVYAFELVQVKKVVPVSALVALPGAPSFVAGITHFSGQILSVVDLRSFFELPMPKNDSRQKLIILRNRDMKMAVFAEEVLGVRELEEQRLQTNLPTLTGVRERYLKGVSPDQTIVLDVAKILSDERLIVDQA